MIRKLCVFLGLVVVLVMVGFVSAAKAQDACLIDEKPHYYVVTGTVKTTMTDPLKALLASDEQLVWTNTFRTFSVVSIAHDDLATCNENLKFLRAQRNIPAKQPIHAIQSVSYEGFCLPVALCHQ